jgi:arabinofuranosyltransferase
MSDFAWATVGRQLRGAPRVVVTDHIGMIGYYAGPSLHLVDAMGLGDPLLSRLPAKPGWRIGHFSRDVPPGYEAGLEYCVAHLFPSGHVFPATRTCLDFGAHTNRLQDPAIREYYETLRMATQGSLTSRSRILTIARLNLGSIRRPRPGG